jgi:hypothetical protein
MSFNSEMVAALVSGFIGLQLHFSQDAILGAIICTLIVMELIPVIHRLVVKE